MSFGEICQEAQKRQIKQELQSVTEDDVRRVLRKNRLNAEDFAILLAPAAENLLEEMARKAHDISLRHFGRTMQMFTPLYLSNFCSNACRYCGFNCSTGIKRKKLTLEEVLAEGKNIAGQGFRQLLILTGEAPAIAGMDYLEDCIKVLRNDFPSVSLEVYALTEDEYRRLAQAGADGMTMYQETYDKDLYEYLHPSGPKADYAFRLDAPERACKAGMRVVNLGALLGLSEDWRKEAYCTALHLQYLHKRYPNTDLAVSPPRMRPHAGSFQPKSRVTDVHMVQMVTAMRIFMPFIGITLSSRESAEFRNNLIPLGITKMSSGSVTAVGGHAEKDTEDTGQFEISDPRSLPEFVSELTRQGYQPVYKDWEPLGAHHEALL